MSGVWSWRQVLGLGQSTRKSASAWDLMAVRGLVEDGVGGQLEGPFGHLTGCIFVAYDLGKWGSVDNRDWVLLKVWLQLLGGKVHAVAHLLVVKVVLL